MLHYGTHVKTCRACNRPALAEAAARTGVAPCACGPPALQLADVRRHVLQADPEAVAKLSKETLLQLIAALTKRPK